MTICAANLAPEVTEQDLRDAFIPFGQVSFVNLIKDRFHKTPVGFAMVVMPVDTEGHAAIAGLNMTELKGQRLKISEAGVRSTPASTGVAA